MTAAFEVNTDLAKIVFQTTGPQSHFFGFYDVSPLDETGRRLLVHRVNFDGRYITKDDKATIGYWDIETGAFTELGVTKAFNWQQGARLQWLPPDYSSRIIYNDREADRFVSVIVDVKSGRRRVIPFPIYAVHPSGEFALGINYERLYFCYKGYCYQGVVNPKWNCAIHEDDGIFRVDLGTGEVDLLVSTRQVADVSPLPEMENGDNWLLHCMWNPSGTRFAFFHRWIDPGQWLYDPDVDLKPLLIGGASEAGEIERPTATRLLTASADGTDIYLFPDSKFYSHMGWKSDTEFTVWGRRKDVHTNPLVKAHRAGHYRESAVLRMALSAYRWFKKRVPIRGRVYKALVDSGAFLQMRDCSDRVEVLGKGVLDEDGHESWHPSGRFMLVDTYPNEERYQRLLLYEAGTDQVKELGRFFAPHTRGYRCDLHPRWDRCGRQIIIDSAHEGGNRQMYVFELELLQ